MRNRKNIPIFVILIAAALIILVLAVGSGNQGGISLPYETTSVITVATSSNPSFPVDAITSQPGITAQPGITTQPDVDNPHILESVPGEIIVKFTQGVSVDIANRRTSSDAFNLLIASLPVVDFKPLLVLPAGEKLEDISILNQYYLIQVSPTANLEALSTQFSALPEVEFSTLNYIGSIDLTPNDTLFKSACEPGGTPLGQWALNDTENANLGATQAWDITTGSDEIEVAVLDTGLDATHPDLAGKNTLRGYDFVNNDPGIQDDQGHGTAVAGIIAAQSNNGEGVAGVSWGARITPVKVCDDEGSCSTGDVFNGIRWAADVGADVINMSLLINTTAFGRILLQDAVNYASVENGVTVVVAAGNRREFLDGSDATLYAPAELDHVIVVGATNENDEDCVPNWLNQAAVCGWGSPGTGHGPLLDVMAPGSANICTTQLGGTYQAHFGGTSAAAPFVSGLASLVLSVNPDLSPEEVENIIKQNADPLDPYAEGVPNWSFGWGRINFYQTVSSLNPSLPIPDASSSTVMVFDTSGSMNDYDQTGITKLDAAKRAGGSILDILEAEAGSSTGFLGQIGLVRFGSDASTPIPLTTDLAEVRTALQRFSARGGTRMAAGLNSGIELLSSSNTNSRKIIILLSDGLPNIMLNGESRRDHDPDVRQELINMATEAGRMGICIYTVGFGDPISSGGSIDEDLLRQLANASGCGEYYSARNATQLANVYVALRHTSTGNVLLQQTGTISQNQEVQIADVEVPQNQSQILFTLNWPTGQIEPILIDPDTQVVDENYPGASLATYESLASVIIQDPKTGQWQIAARGITVPEGNTSYSAILSSRPSPITPTPTSIPVTPTPQPVAPTSPGFPIVILAIALGGGIVAIYVATRVTSRFRTSNRSPGINLPGRAHLVGRKGSLFGKTFMIGDGWIIGRGNACQIKISDPSVSRQHIRFRYSQGHWFIQDLQSSTGTYVNNLKVEAATLKQGDIIRIGSSEFEFRIG